MIVSEDLILNMLIQNKENSIYSKKNPTWLIQIRLEMIEEKREKKVLEIWISMRGLIICNTNKTYFFTLILALL